MMNNGFQRFYDIIFKISDKLAPCKKKYAQDNQQPHFDKYYRRW